MYPYIQPMPGFSDDFARWWQAEDHKMWRQAHAKLEAEGIQFFSAENAWRYQTAQDDCRAFARAGDWTTVTAILEEMATIKNEDRTLAAEVELAEAERYYSSPEYLAEEEARQEEEGRERFQTGNAERLPWFDDGFGGIEYYDPNEKPEPVTPEDQAWLPF